MNTNTYTPSKELLATVLSENVQEVDCEFISKSFGENIYRYYSGGKDYLINIYELVVKTKQKYPSLDLNLAATDISKFWRQANKLAQGANNE